MSPPAARGHDSPVGVFETLASAEVADRLFASSASGGSGDGSGAPAACRDIAQLVATARRPESRAASDTSANSTP